MLALLLTIVSALALFLLILLLVTQRSLRALTPRLQSDSEDSDVAAGKALPFLGELPARINALRSELLERTRAVESQRATYLAILNGLGEGMLALDRERRVVLANRRFGEIFNVTEVRAGQPLGEVVRISAVFDGFDRALEGSDAVEQFSVRSGIVERKIEMRAFPLSSNEIAAAALFLDITHVERLEQIRRNFMSDFSHEVRTPLAGLRSAVETYDGGRLSAEEDQQLRRIMTRQVSRLDRLFNDLSELSRIESGELSLERVETDLRRLILELCEDFAERAAQQRVRLVTGEGSSVVAADPLRIQQAFSNLIDNAIKYGGQDHEVRIEIEDRPDAGVVRVIDQGEGVPTQEREKIFRRFYRVDKSRSQGGTGLGLAITKHLVLLHKGSIDLESELGKGATFIVTLPKR